MTMGRTSPSEIGFYKHLGQAGQPSASTGRDQDARGGVKGPGLARDPKKMSSRPPAPYRHDPNWRYDPDYKKKA